jgi:hypothetical protein
VGELATRDNFAPTIWKIKEQFWMTWIDRNLLREPISVSGLKEGAVVVVGE